MDTLRSQLALLQLQITIDDLTPPESSVMPAKVGIEQVKKHRYPVPSLDSDRISPVLPLARDWEEVKLGAIALGCQN